MLFWICLYLPISAYICLYLAMLFCICLYLPISAYICLYLPMSAYVCLYLPILTEHIAEALISIRFKFSYLCTRTKLAMHALRTGCSSAASKQL